VGLAVSSPTSFHKQFRDCGALCRGENLITVETGETASKNFILSDRAEEKASGSWQTALTAS